MGNLDDVDQFGAADAVDGVDVSDVAEHLLLAEPLEVAAPASVSTGS